MNSSLRTATEAVNSTVTSAVDAVKDEIDHVGRAKRRRNRGRIGLIALATVVAVGLLRRWSARMSAVGEEHVRAVATGSDDHAATNGSSPSVVPADDGHDVAATGAPRSATSR